MRKISYIFGITLLLCVFTACGKKEKEVRIKYIVASETRIAGPDAYGIYSDHYLVKEKPEDEWEYFSPYGVENFDHEPGYEYVILFKYEILDTPPGMVDFYPFSYTVLEILSKELKDSENLPDDMQPEGE